MVKLITIKTHLDGRKIPAAAKKTIFWLRWIYIARIIRLTETNVESSLRGRNLGLSCLLKWKCTPIEYTVVRWINHPVIQRNASIIAQSWHGVARPGQDTLTVGGARVNNFQMCHCCSQIFLDGANQGRSHSRKDSIHPLNPSIHPSISIILPPSLPRSK